MRKFILAVLVTVVGLVVASSAVSFSTASPFNQVIPAGPVLDPNSAAIVAGLASGDHVADLYAYGVPVYVADGTETRRNVTCLEAWGTCPFSGTNTVPLKSTYKPSAGYDGAMVVQDNSRHTLYEFWRYNWNGGSPRTSWGDRCDRDGLGTVTSPPDAVGGNCQGVGAGVSRLAGVIRKSEIAAGVIDHALAFSTNHACPNGNFRYPAQKSDGSNANYSASDCIPEGARIRLAPGVNVDAIAGITPGEKAVAKALQKYGAYAIDVGGARMAFIFEDPNGVTGGDATYNAAGLGWDYFGLDKIPWSQLRVLRNWNGT